MNAVNLLHPEPSLKTNLPKNLPAQERASQSAMSGTQTHSQVPNMGISPHQRIANGSPQVRQLKSLNASANGQPVVQRLVALISDKLEADADKQANEVHAFEPALMIGGLEAKKWTGGPIMLLKDITNEAEGKESISLVGHGTASQATGGKQITDVVASLSDKGFGKAIPDSKRRSAHVNLFSCISGSEAENTPGADAELYKEAFAQKGIDATVLAPKGIAIPWLRHTAEIGMTSITMEQTAVKRAKDTYTAIKNHWKHVAADFKPTKGIRNFLDELDNEDTVWDENQNETFKTSLLEHNRSTFKNNPKLAKRMEAAKVPNQQIAAALPPTLVGLIDSKDRKEHGQATLNLISAQYKNDLDTFRAKGAPAVDMNAKELLAHLRAAISAYDESKEIDPGAGEIENEGNVQFPDSQQEKLEDLGNQGNWVIL
ncbi:MAG: hypothetical protein U0176_10525 [Bacteroidia bacterium]